MMAYLKFISMSFQRSVAYRVEYFTALLNAFLYIFIFTSVWKVLIPEGETMNGLTRYDMIRYAVLSTLVKASMGRNESLLSGRVKSGDIAVDLMKPYSLPLMFFSDTIGTSLFQIFARALPLFLFCSLLFGIELSFPAMTVLKFAVVYLAGFVIFFLMAFLISSTSFYFVDIFPVWIFYWAMVTLSSGAVIPLDFFPVAFKDFLLYTPFPYLFYFPTMILLGKTVAFSFGELLLRYALMAAAVFLAGNAVYRTGLNKMTIAGG